MKFPRLTLGRWLLLAAVAFLAWSSPGMAQVDGFDLWEEINEQQAAGRLPAALKSMATREIVPQAYRTLVLNKASMSQLLAATPAESPDRSPDAGAEIILPLPQGGYGRFSVLESSIMEPALAAQFPEIKSYIVQGIDDPTATGRLDTSPRGFRAMVIGADGTFFIDPYWSNSDDVSICYAKKDFINEDKLKEWSCGVVSSGSTVAKAARSEKDAARPTGATLRIYRAAIAATFEYTTFHGGTKSGALAAIITTLNRVNTVYERDFCLRMVLVGNNASIIYDTASDPYTNGNPGAMITQNQTNVDSVIGDANYDIGHVFGTNSGGLAGLGVVCVTGQKARGVTGSSAPVNDPFDIDYVAHEVGHQFNAEHTFNATNDDNRNGSTAFEPGSGSTIMSYAGIVPGQNLQGFANDYFHTGSYTEIDTFITTGSGRFAFETTATGNSPPVIGALSNYTIPARTPFALTASATDANGDTLTYCWEEYDLGAAQNPVTADPRDNGGSPIFRSYTGTTDPTRLFPSLQYILNNANIPPPTYSSNSATWATGEAIPTTSRAMTYRVSVRDNRAGGGGQNWASTQVTTVSNAGPFRLSSQNTATTLTPGTPFNVTWDVAGTAAAPISAANVKISLSTNGGTNFPVVLAESVPNNGSSSVTIPDGTSATAARLKVEAVGNIFFDINDANLAISASVVPGQITLSGLTPFTENFDSMGASATATLPNGLKMSAAGQGAAAGWETPTNVTAVTQQASSGSPNAGGRYNWGSSVTDRAAGFMTSGNYASPNAIMAKVVNDTGSTMTGLDISFDIERYRINTAAAQVNFFSSTDGVTWTAVSAGDSGAFSTGTSAYTFAAGTVVSKTLSLVGLSVANGGAIYLKWVFVNTGNSNSQGLGLDNLVLRAVVSGSNTPAITTFTPAFGLAGTSVTITGSNFTGATAVAFGGINATTFAVVNATTITAQVPVGAVTGTISVTTPQGTGTSSTDFFVGSSPPPSITATPSLIAGLTATEGTASTSTSYSLVASNLTNDLVIGPTSSAFEVSTNGTTWASSLTLPQTAGALSNTVSVRISATAPVGPASAFISNSIAGSGTSLTNLPSLSGTVASGGTPGLIYWDFNSATPTSGVPEGWVVGALTRGNNMGVNPLFEALAVSTGYVNPFGVPASGTTNANVGAFGGVLDISTNAYFEVNIVPPTSSAAITNISLGTRSSSSGPQAYVIRSSADNFTSDLASGTLSPNSTWVMKVNAPVSIALSNGTNTLRIYGYNGTNSTGTASNWRIDDLTLAVGGLGPVPTITLSTNSLTGFTTSQGTPSTAQSFDVSGENLSTNITVTAPANFEVSPTGADGTYGNTVTVPQSAGVAGPTPVFVRIAASSATGSVSGNVTAASTGATTRNVAVSGNVSALPPEVTLTTTGPLNLGTVAQGDASAPQSFGVTGIRLTANLLVTAPTNCQVSTGNGAPWLSSLSIASPTGSLNQQILVRISPTASPGPISSNVAVGTAGVPNQNVAVTGNVTARPTITPSVTSLAPITKVFDQASPTRNFTVRGNTLSGAVTITAPAPFVVSLSQDTGYASSLSLTPTGDEIALTTIFVRIADGTAVGAISARDITLTGGSAEPKAVSASGEVTLPPPTISPSPLLLEGFSTVAGNVSGAQIFLVSARNLASSNLNLTAPAKYELSTDGGATFAPIGLLPVAGGEILEQSVAVRLAAGATIGTADGEIRLESGAASAAVQVRGEVMAPPALRLRVPPETPDSAETPARVVIDEPAPADVVVSLFSDAVPYLTVPATVTIRKNETSAVFTMRTLSVGADVPVRLDAVASAYLSAEASTIITSDAPRAASLPEEGYRQDFAGFTNDRTLPLGWTNASSSDVHSPWGTTNTGVKFSTETVKVYGYQHGASGTLNTNRQRVLLRNDTGADISKIRIGYDGRTVAPRSPIGRSPAYTVTVTTTSAGAEGAEVINNLTVTGLNYSTDEGDDKPKTASVWLTNSNLPTGIPPWATFTVTWASGPGSGFDESRQIGMSDVKVDLVKPSLQLTPLEGQADFTTTLGQPSEAKPFRVSGDDLLGPVVLTAPDGYEISPTADAGPYGPALELLAPDGTLARTTVFVRLKGAPPVGTVSGALTATSPQASPVVQMLGGTVFTGNTREVFPSTNILSGFVAERPAPSDAQFFFVSGRNLGNSITLFAPAGYQLRVGDSGSFLNIVNIPRNNANAVPPTKIAVRLVSQQLGSVNGTVRITSGTAEFPPGVLLNGQVVPATPLITLSGQFEPFTAERGTASEAQTCTISGTNLQGPLILAAPEGYEIASGGGYGEVLEFAPVNGEVAARTVSVRIADYAPATAALDGELTSTSLNAVPRTLPLTGVVTANNSPWIAARPANLDGFIALPGEVSDPQFFEVEAANLSAALEVRASLGYEISSDGLTWNAAISLSGDAEIAAGAPQIYTDAINDIAGAISSGNGTLDIVSMEVSNTATDVVFAMTVNGNLSTTDWGNFAIGIANGKTAGSTTGNGWGRPINLDAGGGNGMTHWIGSWVNGPGGSQFWTYSPGGGGGTDSNWSGPAPLTAFSFAGGPRSLITYRVPMANLGVGEGDTIIFDAYSTGADGNPSAVDALSNPNVTITDWPGPYTSSDATGLSTYTVTPGGGGGGGNIPRTVLLVRLAETAPVGSVPGSIQASSSPALPRVISLSGRVAEAPVLTVTPEVLANFSTTEGMPSAPAKSFSVSGRHLDGSVEIVAPSGFEISLSNAPGSAYQGSISLPASGELPATLVYVRITASALAGNVAGTIRLIAPGELGQTSEAAVAVSGMVFRNDGTPQIGQPDPDQLGGFFTTQGTPSAAQSFIVSAVSLSGNLTAAAPPGYEVSATGASGNYGQQVSVSPGAALAGAIFHVRIAGTAPVADPLSGNLTLSSAGANSATVVLNGEVAVRPTLAVNPSSLSDFEEAIAGVGSQAKTFVLTGEDLAGPVTVQAPASFQVSATGQPGSFDSTVVIAKPADGAALNATVYVRVGPAAVVGLASGSVTFESQGVIDPPTVSLTAEVLPRPEVSATPSALSGFISVTGYPSATREFVVRGDNLLGDININLPSPTRYEISLDGVAWVDSISLAPVYGAAGGGGRTTVAADNAGNYVQPGSQGISWTNGANAGSGFGAWSIAVNQGTGGSAGNFIGDPASAGLTGFGSQAFGLYANPAASGASVTAARTLPALQPGDVFSFEWGVNWDTGSTNTKGFRLFAGTQQILEVGQSSFPGEIRTVVAGVTNNTGITFGTGPMTWSFAMSEGNILAVTSTARDGSADPVYTTNLVLGAAPDSFAWYAGAMGAGDQRQPYYNNLLLTTPGGGGSGGEVANTTVYVRLKASAAVGSANEQIAVTSSFALPRNVSLSGVVGPAPTLTITPERRDGFTAVEDTPGSATVQSFQVAASNLVGDITVVAPLSFEVSTAADSGFGSATLLTKSGDAVNASVYVRLATSSAPGSKAGAVRFSTPLGPGQLLSLEREVTGRVISWPEGNPNSLRVTNPASPVSVAGNIFNFGGQAGVNLTNAISWFNLETSQTGSFQFVAPNWTNGMPLAPGTNTVVFRGQYRVATATNTNAFDIPGNSTYTNGWTNGSSGGFGFGVWDLRTTNQATNFRTDRNVSTNMHVGAINGFALRAGSRSAAVARRALGQPLAPLGGVFEIVFDSNEVEPGGKVGLALADANNVNRFEFFASGDESNFRVADGQGANRDTGIELTDQGLRVRFESSGADTYRLVTATLSTPPVTNIITGVLREGAALGRFVVFNEAAGPGSDNTLYIGRMMTATVDYQWEDVEVIAPVVVQTASEAYDVWAASFFGLDDPAAARGADPDKDGFSNLLEFAFGTDPTSPNGEMVAATRSGSSLRMIYLERLSGASYQVQHSSNLHNDFWPQAQVIPEPTPDQSRVPDGYRRMAFDVPLAERSFYRVQATVE